MSDQPHARVRAFIADWASEYDDIAPTRSAERWAEAVRGLEERHFVPGARCAAELPSEAEHAAGREMIIDQRVSGDSASIQTRQTHKRFYQYELARIDGEWRIRAIRTFAKQPRSLKGSPPLFTDEKRASILAMASGDADLGPPLDASELDGDRAFVDGKSLIGEDGSKTRIQVKRVGMLRTSSGILGVEDFTRTDYDFPPLARKVAPGTYAVEVAIAWHSVAAVRVLLAPDRATVAWHPAPAAGCGPDEYGVGVDAANVAIFDVASLVRLTKEDHERVHEELASCEEEPQVLLASMSEENDCVIVESGYGDGVYPCYWGVDADGVVTVLQVEFIAIRKSPPG